MFIYAVLCAMCMCVESEDNFELAQGLLGLLLGLPSPRTMEL